MMKTQALTLEHDGLTLSATLHGENDQPLVVLLHGFPDTPHSWDKVVPPLVAAGYRVLTPWLRGYTQGSASRQAHYDLLTVSTDIVAWVKHLNEQPDEHPNEQLSIKQAHLVGHDWGAAVANVLAGQQTTATGTGTGTDTGTNTNANIWQSISLLAVPPMPTKSQWRQLLPQLPKQLWYSAYMPVMQLSASHRLVSRNNAAYVRRLWQQWSPTWHFSEAEFAPTQQLFSKPELAWATTRYYRNLFRWYDPAVRQAVQLMQQPFSVPTLVLAGADDGCMHKNTHQKIAKTATSRGPVITKLLDDCGHFLQAEQPQAVATALLEHFKNSQ